MSDKPINRYKKTLESIPVEILAGQTTSNLVYLGGMQLRGVIFPTGWTTCDLSFNGSILDINYTGFQTYAIQNFDGINQSALTIPQVTSLTWVPLYAHWFDSVPYIQLSCSIPQTNTISATFVLQPLYQGIHN